MPLCSGRGLYERLSATRADLKVVYMSGYTDTAIVHHGMLDPNISFIQKPFRRYCRTRSVGRSQDGVLQQRLTPEGLVRAVRKAIDGSESGG